MNKLNGVLFVALSGALMATGVAVGDDFAPPPWRGAPLSVEAEWEFSTPFTSVDIFPEFFNSVGGSMGEVLYNGFSTKAELDSTSNWMWTMGDGDGGITPTMGNGAVVSFKVQNWVDFEPIKWLRVQVTHQGAPPMILGVTGVMDQGAPVAGLVGNVFVDPQHFYEDWWIEPNPWWEHVDVFVPFGTTLDEVYIDTVSWIPAPSTAVLLAMAGLIAARRRR